MRFVLSLVAIVLAFFVGIFAEHDFRLVDGTRQQCCWRCKKCTCEVGKCDCCAACLGKNTECTCGNGQCDCCQNCPGHK
jgi:hypothetical protein